MTVRELIYKFSWPVKYLVRDFLNMIDRLSSKEVDGCLKGLRCREVTQSCIEPHKVYKHWKTFFLKTSCLLLLPNRDPNHKELVVLGLLCNPFFPHLLVTINWPNKKACNKQNVSRFFAVLRWCVTAQHLKCSPPYTCNLGQSQYNRVQKRTALCSPNVLPNVHRVTVLGTVLNG